MGSKPELTEIEVSNKDFQEIILGLLSLSRNLGALFGAAEVRIRYSWSLEILTAIAKQCSE